MPESYTPREIINNINSKNPGGAQIDLYGSAQLRKSVQDIEIAKGDVFATTNTEIAQQQAERQVQIDEAKRSFEEFKNYLMSVQSQTEDDDAREGIKDVLKGLGKLKVDYDETMDMAVIDRTDDFPLILDLGSLGLTGVLPLPKQLMLDELICSDNQLTAITELPISLKELVCKDNRLTGLPPLPEGLIVLHCEKNQISSLPELPEGLQELYCNRNPLTELPELPDSLRIINYSADRLKPEALAKIKEKKNKIGFINFNML